MQTFQGLTQEEAQIKLKEFGANEIQEVNKVSWPHILLRQVKKNFVIYLLTFTAIISFFLGERITTYVIAGVIGIVILTGFFQEYKAEKAISALKRMIMPISRVIRNGKEREVPSGEIVPGDIVILRTGEKVPADCVIVEESSVKVNEAVLTGESIDVKKSVPLSDEYTDEHLVFMGSFIVSGKCTAKVVHTGMRTKFGQIAGMISTAEKHLPLQDKVNSISKYMVVVGMTAAMFTGIVLFARADAITYEVIVGILIIVIALSVSSFPEGFPVVLISTLAAGVNRMAKQNAVVNRMSIIETLGETSVICTDKTGTLTKGEMTVKKLYAGGILYDVSGVGYEAKGEFSKEGVKVQFESTHPATMMIKSAVVCNDSNIERLGDDALYKIIGSSTEGALLILAAKVGLFKEDYASPRVNEIPFDSNRKMMSVAYGEDGKHSIYAKGAPEVLIKKCTYIQREHGREELTDGERQKILAFNQELTSQALRSLAFAYKIDGSGTKDYTEDEFVFLGIAGMEDPPRAEVKEAIAACIQSGIQVKMITGDSPETAQAIASQIGLFGDVLEGIQLDALTDEELKEKVKSIAIFSRVKPEHKLRIVKALKANDEIVTMTGDGVNDAPALKEAHIGVAMGINGTDVSRSVADITLKDDNFATIVVAIKEGRTIFNNIRKFVTYQLSCNLSDIVLLFIGMLAAPFLGWYVPIITALQILFINIVTDNMPAITLGFTPTSHDIMKEKPRRNAQILTREFINLIILNGVAMGSIAIGVTYLAFNVFHLPSEVARTTVLLSIILMQIANAFNFRSFRYRVLNRGLLVNRPLVLASTLSVMMTLLIVYTPLSHVFETTALSIESWIVAGCAAFLIVLLFDIFKTINNKTHKFLHYIH